MRILERNTTRLWLVNPSGFTDVIDSDGFLTGEQLSTYTVPVVVKLSLYPATGSVVEKVFGKDSILDLVAVTTDVELSKESLLFLRPPVDGQDYSSTYDYRVSDIKPSLNVFNYGLRRRT